MRGPYSLYHQSRSGNNDVPSTMMHALVTTQVSTFIISEKGIPNYLVCQILIIALILNRLKDLLLTQLEI